MKKLLLLLVPATLAAQQPQYDLVIAGGTIIDGTGRPPFAGDIAINGDRIVLVSQLSIPMNRAKRLINATSRIVAPGFIDMHAHLDPLPNLPDMQSALRQGVTFALGNPDGGGFLPLAPYMVAREQQGIGANVGYLVGHNSVKQRVMGTVSRLPTGAEMDSMKALIAAGMRDGAFGISTGLRYLPGNFSKIDEVIALSKVAAESGGIYTSHLREEGLGLMEGVAEAITIGREAKIPIVLTHHKAIGVKMWGQSVATLRMIDSARKIGIDVMADAYPYTASSTGLSVLIPTWAFDGGDSSFVRRTKDPALRDSIKKGIVFNILNDRGGGDIARVQFSNFRYKPDLNGKTLSDWAKQRGLAATPENGADLVIEAELNGGASSIFHVIDEKDVQRILAHPQVMIGSDGRLSRPGDGTSPHPRAYGTFPRVLGLYVRDLKLMSLEAGIYKMTGQSAARLGLKDRGVLKQGMYADVVVFNAATIADKATFENPAQYPVGIDYVFVNGVAAVDGGKFTDARAGRVIRRSK